MTILEGMLGLKTAPHKLYKNASKPRRTIVEKRRGEEQSAEENQCATS